MSEIYRKILEARKAEEQARLKAQIEAQRKRGQEDAARRELERRQQAEEQRKEVEQRDLKSILERCAVTDLDNSPAVKELVRTFQAISEGEWRQPAGIAGFEAIYRGDYRIREQFPLDVRRIKARREDEIVLGEVTIYLGVRNRQNGLLVASILEYERERALFKKTRPKLRIGIIVPSIEAYKCHYFYEKEFVQLKESVAKSLNEAIRNARPISINEVQNCDCYSPCFTSTCHVFTCNCGP
ncbi:MAG: hypothetical protein M1514_02775 [Patescibacteria group bacterium]|nr:hypothetical protein [Patescibacteria group bacterium]